MGSPGRPSIFTQELAAKICERLAAGESLRAICEDDGMPNRHTVAKWAEEDREGFAAQYAQARDHGLDVIAEECFAIVDDGRNDWIEKQKANGETFVALNDEAIARSRLRFDARRWYLSKLAPKRYGDKLQHEHSGSVDVNHALIDARKRAGGS